MSASKMMEWIIDQEEFYFDNISFLEKRMVEIGDKKGWLYFYRIKEKSWDDTEENNDWYLGACGLYLNEQDMLGGDFHPEFDWEPIREGSSDLTARKEALIEQLKQQAVKTD